MKFAVVALLGLVSGQTKTLSTTKCAKAADCTGETSCASLSFDGIAMPEKFDDTVEASAKAWAKTYGAD